MKVRFEQVGEGHYKVYKRGYNLLLGAVRRDPRQSTLVRRQQMWQHKLVGSKRWSPYLRGTRKAAAEELGALHFCSRS